jgi:hypothetical protein
LVLADANEARDWRVYASVAQRLIATSRDLGNLPGRKTAQTELL